MKYDPKNHHRKSIRLKGYDYSRAGLYFVTICCQKRICLFGEIVDGKMELNNAGAMVERIWNGIPDDFINIKLHEMVIMPNHIHGIIEIAVGADSISAQFPSVQSLSAQFPLNDTNRADMESAPTLSTVVQSFKRYVTIEYIKMVKQQILPPFNKRIWQRNYWEHIIRNENEYRRISEYINNNPSKWDMDKLNGCGGNQIMESPVIYGQNISCLEEEAWII